MSVPFYGSRLKIERAVHHINDLLHRVYRIVNDNPHIIVIDKDVDGRGDILKLGMGATLPDNLIPILGDAFHNLRTALDFAMTDIVFKPGGYTKFPVYDTVDKLKMAVNGGLKENARKEIIDFIVDVIQPYEGGNGHAIWALHALDIEDKHRLLLTHIDFTTIEGMRAIDDRGEEFAIPHLLLVHPNMAPHLCIGHHNIKITNYGEAMHRVSFGEGLPMHGEFILPALRQMTEFVAGTINGLESVFLALK